ncbi:hypothetical protein BWI97_09035 [Siphonobacter sp. BAB-5405]|uniref:GLPGLI family protein n=1 Tax=Siphonobacter sp. BAB-5405 TaxID=1864825 RepID=UPI000C803F84|nr:GLPGLI family protein [Siphonobacter sp. BAB-5405]PMD97201.1 hypothetical protein BWI97_09035 [Siphonobacter sp. BAB-5405]
MKMILCFIGLLSNGLYAQSQVGIINYRQLENQPLDPGYSGNGTLIITKTSSFYTEKSLLADKEGEEIKDQVNISTIYGKSSNNEIDQFYLDFSKRQVLSNERILSQFFPVKDTLLKPQWKISTEKRKIGGYDCLKAVGMVRNRTYTAWFTPAIPVSAGPWKLWGLPGLILEATSTDGAVKFLFQSLQLTPNGPTLNPPKFRKKPVTLAQFIAYRKERLRQMKKMDLGSNFKEVGGLTEINTFSVENFPN